MAFGRFTFLVASNAVLILTGALSLPLYLSFYGSEAAARFSLLLCIHAVLLASVPKVLKPALSMIQLVLLLLLLLLPFSLTPVFVVWFYEAFLLLLDPVFSVIEVIQIVLVVMYISQSFVDKIDERPLVVKSGILVVSGVSYLLSTLFFCNLFGAFNTSVTETWIGILALTLSMVLFCICLYKDEGIISDAAVLTLLMSFIVWAIKQERLIIMGENPVEAPSQWLQPIDDDRSFLNLLLSMAKTSLEHLTCAKRIIQTILSPSFLLLALVRVGSIVGFVAIVHSSRLNEDESQFEDTSYREEPKSRDSFMWPLLLHLVIIFVYTELVIRTINASLQHDSHSKTSMSSKPLMTRISGTGLWRVIQLFIVPIAYIYQLFAQRD